eukprot:1902443-Prymnesium_polylepis.1
MAEQANAETGVAAVGCHSDQAIDGTAHNASVADAERAAHNASAAVAERTADKTSAAVAERAAPVCLATPEASSKCINAGHAKVRHAPKPTTATVGQGDPSNLVAECAVAGHAESGAAETGAAAGGCNFNQATDAQVKRKS